MSRCPDYIIIGVQRCGTTSLYEYICQHPGVKRYASRTSRKELHFFDYWHNYKKGAGWYKGHFNFRRIVGEASPTYLQHRVVPVRIKHICPNAQFIVLLRNPINRAYSAYKKGVAKGYIKRSFWDLLRTEEERLDEERWTKDVWGRDFYYSDHHLRAFVDRGMYAEQLRRWFKIFPREQFLILKSESFFQQRKRAMRRVFSFLGLEHYDVSFRTVHQRQEYKAMGNQEREYLRRVFREPCKELVGLLGEEFKWRI